MLGRWTVSFKHHFNSYILILMASILRCVMDQQIALFEFLSSAYVVVSLRVSRHGGTSATAWTVCRARHLLRLLRRRSGRPRDPNVLLQVGPPSSWRLYPRQRLKEPLKHQ